MSLFVDRVDIERTRHINAENYQDAIRERDAREAVLKADLAEAVRLLDEARDFTDEVIQRNKHDLGSHLTYKQEPAIECLLKLDAFITKHKGTK